MAKIHRFGFACLITVFPFAGNVLAQQPMNSWVHGDAIQWTPAEGQGISIKTLLNRDNGFVDDLLRAAFLVRIDPGGSYATVAFDNEDRVFYVTAGQAKFVLGDQQIDAKPGDAFGVPAGTKHAITNGGTERFEMIAFAAPSRSPAANLKPLFGRADDLQWQPSPSHGPGCELKLILPGGFSSAIRGLWIIRVNGYGINTVHSIGEDQVYYIFEAPQPQKDARDGRTAAARVIVGDQLVQTRVGDAFYFAGPPKPVEHGIFNESKDKPLIYVGIGLRNPTQSRGAGR